MLQNRAVLAYRNQLFSLLPGSVDSFDMAMQDAANRMNSGITCAAIMGPLKAAITEWVGDANAQQLNAVAAALHKLGAMGANDRIAPYTSLAVDHLAYKWQKETPVDAKELDALAATLKKDVAHPPDQLGFKKDE